MVSLKGEKITLRSVKRSDLEFFKNWRNSHEIWNNNTQFVLLNMEHQNSWFESLNDPKAKKKMFTIINKTKTPIGICGLIQIDSENKNAKVAIIIGRTELHSHGIGTESLDLLLTYGFERLKIHRIEAEVLEFNKKSKNFFQKSGFKLDATFRDYIFRNGKCWKLFSLSKLSHD